jgi:hypothetical protein
MVVAVIVVVVEFGDGSGLCCGVAVEAVMIMVVTVVMGKSDDGGQR